jgi:hypothetical protein
MKISKYKIDFASSALKLAYVTEDYGLPCTTSAKKNVRADCRALDVRVIRYDGNLLAVSEEEFKRLGYPEVTIDNNHEEVK